MFFTKSKENNYPIFQFTVKISRRNVDTGQL